MTHKALSEEHLIQRCVYRATPKSTLKSVKSVGKDPSQTEKVLNAVGELASIVVLAGVAVVSTVGYWR